jgi:hypothetical protein
MNAANSTPHINLARRLRRTARALRSDLAGEATELQTLLEAHGHSSLAVVLVVLAVPAMIPVPGVPVGAIMSVGMYLVALAMILGLDSVPLPRRLAQVKLSGRLARIILHRMAWLYAWTGRYARPRLGWLTGAAAKRCLGLFVAVMATVIFLPIPLGNIAPGAALVMLALSLLFMDGLGVLVSLGMGGLALGYMAALGGGAIWAASLLGA